MRGLPGTPATNPNSRTRRHRQSGQRPAARSFVVILLALDWKFCPISAALFPNNEVYFANPSCHRPCRRQSLVGFGRAGRRPHRLATLLRRTAHSSILRIFGWHRRMRHVRQRRRVQDSCKFSSYIEMWQLVVGL